MCAFAAALGYKEIYIAGIDLYNTNRAYAFETLKPNLLSIYPNFMLTPSDFHTKETDILALKFLANNYDVKFYTICPNSPLSEYIPLANKNNRQTFIPMTKSQDSIKDMLIPQKLAYDNLYYQSTFRRKTPYDKPNNNEVENYKKSLKSNIFYRAFKDIGKLPKDIANYIKGGMLEKINKLKNHKDIEGDKKQTMGGGGNNPTLL